jgi:ATP-binding cassette subfamily F protein 3
MLGRLLLEEPDLLLLDEPTNHLDLSAVEWLERYLQDVPTAMVIVSHDRYFLDRVCSRTWEVAAGSLSCYRGGYSQYVRQRKQRLLEQTRLYEQQQEYIARTEEFIRRNLAGQRTKEAQGRRTRLERFKATEAVPPPQQTETISLHLNPDRPSSENVLRTHELAVGYVEGQPLVALPDVEVSRRRRIAIVGPNGCGKTTLLKTLRAELPALSGQVRWGANVDVGYLSQAHEELAGGGTVFQAVHGVDPGRTPEQVRTLLGSMGFAGDAAFKKVDELSGGQRSRVILAQLATQGANVLLLDEPTNHLDLPSREILQETLKEFEGTVIMVSHDRYLIDSVATDIWAIADGVLHRIYGNWEDYLTWRAAHQAGQASTSTAAQKARAADKQAGRDAHFQRKERNRLIRRHEKLEGQIHQGEQKLEKLSEAISTAGEAGEMDKVESLGREYQQAQQQLDELMAEWERVGEQIEMSDA